MAPRTRATATVAAPTTLAAAPRRRLKVTPLDNDEPVKTTKNDLTARPATRSTRSNSITIPEPTPAISKPVAAKSRGRPKRADTVLVEQETIQEPKRVTRSTRATSTTASSEAKEKPTARSRKTTGKEETLPIQSQPSEQTSAQNEKPVTTAIVRKKVTFQDIVEDDKENQPMTRAAKKTAASKPLTATGLRAKPVRKPASAATKSMKRSKGATSDDEQDSKPRKIQRVLTPKKVTQLARAETPDESSDDELNGGKTPVRDLSLSPKRPQSAKMTAAVLQNLSPVKSLIFTQSLHAAQHTDLPTAEPTLASPAKRLSSPTKLSINTTVKSPVKVFNDELATSLASPAKRPMISPVKEAISNPGNKTNGNASKLLFPQSTQRDHLTTSISSTTNLAQSPKRPATFDPSRIFAQSAVKARSKDFSKSSFFSSPAKRHGLFSPVKQTLNTPVTGEQASVNFQSLDELDLNEMEVTNLLEDGIVETTVTSCQRASASPLRPVRLFEDNLDDELDNSILPVRSPMKVSKSPERTLQRSSISLHEDHSDTVEDITEAISSVQSSPYGKVGVDKSFISLHAVENGTDEIMEEANNDFVEAEINDDTIVLMEEVPATPFLYHLEQHDTSQDELAIQSGEDMMAKYVKIPGNTPGTPATLNEHELTQMLSSPNMDNETATADGTPCTMRISSPILEGDIQRDIDMSINYSGNIPHITPLAEKVDTRRLIFPTTHDSVQSPASLHEHELTMMGARNKSPAVQRSPVSVAERELTIMAERDISEADSSPVHDPQVPSPTFILDEHELTGLGEVPAGHVESLNVNHDSAGITSKPATPSVPILRKFNINTVVTKIPLKPEGQDSPIKLNIKKRKRPFSLGGNPDADSTEIFVRPGSAKSARTEYAQDVASPLHDISDRTPISKISARILTTGSVRRTVSAPVARSPLTPVVSVNDKVLYGAVVFVDVRTSEGADASAIYVELLSNLGATILKDWKSTPPTHVIYKDGRPKILEKIRLAAAEGLDLKCVGVSWPLDCEAQQTWLDESSYTLKLTQSEQVLGSVTKSAKRKSMEPSTLIADGTGSIKRSRSRSRLSMSNRKSIGLGTTTVENTLLTVRDCIDMAEDIATPLANAARKHADTEKLSLTAAWKSINATQNLGDDTPARKTLDLLQRSYAAEQEWDSTLLSNGDEADENTYGDENMPQETGDNDNTTMIIDTGLTPAPYRTKQQIGSAPGKINGASGFMSYRERVEEMERREMRDTARGVQGGQRGKKDGRRVTIFGN